MCLEVAIAMRTAIAVGHVRALSMSCYIHPLEQYKATYDVMTRSWPAAALHSMASGVGVIRQSQPLPFLPGGGEGRLHLSTGKQGLGDVVEAHATAERSCLQLM